MQSEGFPQELLHFSRMIIWLGVKTCNCNSSHQKTNSDDKIVTCNHFDDKDTLRIFQKEKNQKFRKGLAGRGGWREEILPMPEIQTSFLCPFSYATLRRRGTQFWGSICAVFGDFLVANPLPPTPFSEKA